MTPPPVPLLYHVRIWGSILAVAGSAITGDVLTARAMRRIGDLDEIRAHSGMPGAIKAVIGEPSFLLGVGAMTLSFFSLLFALSPPAPVSLIAPATASLTYVGNAFVAKYFLHENVDRRRWVAAVFACIGVFLLTM
jgi:multidrug transporter EmrE-like cation transporter